MTRLAVVALIVSTAHSAAAGHSYTPSPGPSKTVASWAKQYELFLSSIKFTS